MPTVSDFVRAFAIGAALTVISPLLDGAATAAVAVDSGGTAAFSPAPPYGGPGGTSHGGGNRNKNKKRQRQYSHQKNAQRQHALRDLTQILAPLQKAGTDTRALPYNWQAADAKTAPWTSLNGVHSVDNRSRDTQVVRDPAAGTATDAAAGPAADSATDPAVDPPANPPADPVVGAQPVPTPVPMRTTGTGDYTLSWNDRNAQGNTYGDLIRQLRQDLQFSPPGYSYTKVSELLAGSLPGGPFANRRCPAPMQDSGALVTPQGERVRNVVDWFCLAPDDATGMWTPQGISGTWDSTAQGTAYEDTAQAFVFSWHGPANNASRVTFLNEVGVGPFNHYQHVLLVNPFKDASGPVSFDPMRIHAGGVVWYHQYLLIADDNREHPENNGILVFDLRDLFDLGLSAVSDITNTGRPIGLHNGTYYSQGYRYILPLRGIWRPQVTGVRCASMSSPPCFGYLGLDRSTSPPSVLTGEWCDPRQPTPTCRPATPQAAAPTGRVARYRMAPDTSACDRGCLAYGTDNRARATAAYTQPTPWTQGGISWNGLYQFTMSNNRTATLGRRYEAVPGGQPVAHFAARGVQELYWHRSGGPAQPPILWSITEGEGVKNRVLYGVNPWIP
ncbi:hypothetical protein [Microbispora sp. H10836]|uniref:hypothetical protein n=1 Tax=Microbispora sp. H10836 TaxID=2729106 RepID=UPI00147569B1|nr:hypothetical protein [Microbispora sp. H10836]